MTIFLAIILNFKRNLLFALAITFPALTWAQEYTQIVNLAAGWNAIYLEVQAANRSPEALFAQLPVDHVTTYFGNLTPVEFIKDPNEKPWKQPGWHNWFRLDDAASQAVLNDLNLLQAGQAFLIHATKPTRWKITGTRHFQRPTWQANAFNLMGFAVDPQSPPTFAHYFAGSAAHRKLIIFQLEKDHWQQVAPQTAIIPSRAYWTWCEGGSDWMGPIDITLSGAGLGLDFQDQTQVLSLVLRNKSNTAHEISLNLVNPFPVALKITGADGTAHLKKNLAALPNPLLAAGERREIRLAVLRAQIPAAGVSGLLEVMTDIGVRYLIPLAAL